MMMSKKRTSDELQKDIDVIKEKLQKMKKEQKKLQAMLNDLAVGGAVITTSGFYGVVIDITDDDVIVEFGNNKNCRIPMRKTAITEVEKPETAVVEEKTEKKK